MSDRKHTKRYKHVANFHVRKRVATFGRCSRRILLLTMLWPIIPLNTAVCGRTERMRLERVSTRGCWLTS